MIRRLHDVNAATRAGIKVSAAKLAKLTAGTAFEAALNPVMAARSVKRVRKTCAERLADYAQAKRRGPRLRALRTRAFGISSSTAQRSGCATSPVATLFWVERAVRMQQRAQRAAAHAGQLTEARLRDGKSGQGVFEQRGARARGPARRVAPSLFRSHASEVALSEASLRPLTNAPRAPVSSPGN